MTVGADDIPVSYDDAVSRLTKWHAEAGPADLKIFWFPDPREESVRLLEVSEDFQFTAEIRPFTLGRSKAFPFRSSVALVTPREWVDVESGVLPLPDGWDRTAMKQVWP